MGPGVCVLGTNCPAYALAIGYFRLVLNVIQKIFMGTAQALKSDAVKRIHTQHVGLNVLVELQ